tara:strand:+ start:808 stop:1167 length:360 start_codon:yes stop_codon:yes gene_type:complete
MSLEIKLTFAVATSGDLASWSDGYHSASIGPLNNEQIDFMEQIIAADQELHELFQDKYTDETFKDVTEHRYGLLEKGRELGVIKSKFFGRSNWTLITVDAGNGFDNVDYPHQNLGQEVQ